MIPYAFVYIPYSKIRKILKISEIPNSNYHPLYYLNFIIQPQNWTVMDLSLGRFKISAALITICIGPFSIGIQKMLDLGQEVFVIRGTFLTRKKRLYMYIYIYVYIHIYRYTHTPRT